MTVSPENVAHLPGAAEDTQGVRIKIFTFPPELACAVMAKGLITTTTPFFPALVPPTQPILNIFPVLTFFLFFFSPFFNSQSHFLLHLLHKGFNISEECKPEASENDDKRVGSQREWGQC